MGAIFTPGLTVSAHHIVLRDRRRAELVRAKARLEGLVDSNQKTFNEFGSMLAPEKLLSSPNPGRR